MFRTLAVTAAALVSVDAAGAAHITLEVHHFLLDDAGRLIAEYAR